MVGVLSASICPPNAQPGCLIYIICSAFLPFSPVSGQLISGPLGSSEPFYNCQLASIVWTAAVYNTALLLPLWLAPCETTEHALGITEHGQYAPAPSVLHSAHCCSTAPGFKRRATTLLILLPKLLRCPAVCLCGIEAIINIYCHYQCYL